MNTTKWLLELGAAPSNGVSPIQYQASLKTAVKRSVTSSAVPSPCKSPHMSPSAAKQSFF